MKTPLGQKKSKNKEQKPGAVKLYDRHGHEIKRPTEQPKPRRHAEKVFDAIAYLLPAWIRGLTRNQSIQLAILCALAVTAGITVVYHRAEMSFVPDTKTPDPIVHDVKVEARFRFRNTGGGNTATDVHTEGERTLLVFSEPRTATSGSLSVDLGSCVNIPPARGIQPGPQDVGAGEPFYAPLIFSLGEYPVEQIYKGKASVREDFDLVYYPGLAIFGSRSLHFCQEMSIDPLLHRVRWMGCKAPSPTNCGDRLWVAATPTTDAR